MTASAANQQGIAAGAETSDILIDVPAKYGIVQRLTAAGSRPGQERFHEITPNQTREKEQEDYIFIRLMLGQFLWGRVQGGEDIDTHFHEVSTI